METTAYRPFETSLPEDEALAILRSATHGADDGEIFAERRKSEALVFDDGRLRSASYDAAEGFGLRAVNGDVRSEERRVRRVWRSRWSPYH